MTVSFDKLRMSGGIKIKNQKLKAKMTDKNAKILTGIIWSLRFRCLNLFRILGFTLTLILSRQGRGDKIKNQKLKAEGQKYR